MATTIQAPLSLDPDQDNTPVSQTGSRLPGGFFEDLLSGGVATKGVTDQIDRLQKIGENARTGSETIGAEAVTGTEFKPFTTASQTGNVAVDPLGSIDAQLSDQLGGISNQALGGASTLFDQAAIDPNTRQGQIFQQLMAGLAPQQDRERLALEGRLQSQGRGGISSAAFGGSPEQLALAKAQQEQQLSALIQARGIGAAEQAQQGALGSQFLTSGLTPTRDLFNQITPAIQSAQLGAEGRLAGQDLKAQAETTGLEAQIQAEIGASELTGDLFGAASGLAGGLGAQIDNRPAGQSVWDFIIGSIT